MPISRREFLAANAAAALSAAAAPAAQGETKQGALPLAFDPKDPNLKYDLLVAGGTVIDPGQKLHARRDVAIKNGQIAAIEESIAKTRAAQVIDATGNLITPGLVDLHCHYYHQVSRIGLPADEMMGLTATTTGVDAGDAGYSSFPGFRHHVIGQSRTRLFAFIHISAIGLAGDPLKIGEMLNIDYADVDSCARAVAENRDVCLGVKVRLSKNVVGQNGIEPLRRAIKAAQIAGPWARVMCHIGNAPVPLAEVLDMMRPGDIVTHTYSNAGETNAIVAGGKLLPQALEARRRGVIFDVGHGGGSFDFTIAESAMKQGLEPDTISSDVHSASIQSPGKPLLPWVVSKFLSLGISLDAAIAKATVEPARIIDRVPGLGTLQIGAPADVAVFRLVEGPVTFVDTNKHERPATQYLDPVKTIRQGRPFGFPFPDPFTYT
ncbi:MAG: amidohydrolase/deacetylase family metallohydrolase [Myxococcales bacterium]